MNHKGYHVSVIVWMTIIMLLPVYLHTPIFFAYTLFLLVKYREDLPVIIGRHPLEMGFLAYSQIVALYHHNYLGALVPFGYLLFYLFAVHYRRWITLPRYLSIIRIIIIGSIPVAGLAVYDYLTYAYSHHYDLWYIFKYATIQTRAESTFFNANYYLLFCIMVIIAVCYYQLKHRQLGISTTWWHKILLTLAVVLNIIGLVLTAARMFIPTLAVGLIVFFFWANRRYSYWIMVLAVVIGGIIWMNPEWMPRFESVLYAFEDRWQLWDTGWKLFLQQPVTGSGAMSYLHGFHRFTDKADMHAHNLYINFLANYGWMGLGMAIIIIGQRLRRLYQVWHRGTLRLECALVASVIAIILVHGLVDVAIFWSQSLYFAIILIAPIDCLLINNTVSEV